jgi:type IV secretion system protein VirD4
VSQGTHSPFAAKIIVGSVLLGGAWTVIASMTFLLGTRLIGQFAHPFYQWWLYLFLARNNQTVATWLLVSGILASAVMLVFALALLFGRRRLGPSLRPRLFGGQSAPIRGATDNHGHAAWKEMRKVRELFPGPTAEYGGLVVGEAYRVDQDSVASMPFDPANKKSWGQGGKAPLLIDPCTSGSTHSLIFAGSGAFKSQSAISTLLHWTGSAVVLDPAGELGGMTASAREQMGHTVHLLSLRGNEGFNVLDWIDLESPEATTNIKSVVQWICGDAPSGGRDSNADEFFRSRGQALAACLLAHLLADPDLDADLKTVATLRHGIAIPVDQMRAVLKKIFENSPSRFARDQAGPIMGLVDETFSGVVSSADDMTEWLANEAAAKLVSGSSFKSSDIRNGQTTIFLNLSLKALQTMPGLARTVIGAFLNSAYEANGALSGRILFLLDEVARLGFMGILETARDAGRKYGITLQMLYQSVGQIEKQWGRDGKRAWYDGVSHRTYAAIADPDTAKELEETFGTYGVMATSQGNNTGTTGKNFESGSRSRGANESYHEISRPLIRRDELLNDCRSDEAFIVMRGARIRCGRAISFRRSEMMQRLTPNHFAAASIEQE